MQNVVLIISGLMGVQVPPGVKVIYDNTVTGQPVEQSENIDLEITDPVTKQVKKLSELKKEKGWK
jgi:hypothetical protein